MTPQEAQMLQDLVQKVQGTDLTEKDPDAEALLKDGLARDPDAIYKLAQTVLIQNLAIDQARAQIQQLRQQPVPQQQQPARATSFLGSLLHRNPPAQQQAPPPGCAQGGPAGWQQVPPQYQQAPPPYQGAPGYYGQVPGQPSAAGGFLRSAATTAAGVAGGMLAFEGVESLLHGFEHGGGYGGGWGGGYPGGFPGGGAPAGEMVINNYYDSPQDQGGYGANGPDEQPQGPYNDADGPDEQPQGPYDASSDVNGPDEQPQGPYDDGGNDDSGSDQGYLDDSGGGDFGGDGGDNYS